DKKRDLKDEGNDTTVVRSLLSQVESLQNHPGLDTNNPTSMGGVFEPLSSLLKGLEEAGLKNLSQAARSILDALRSVESSMESRGKLLSQISGPAPKPGVLGRKDQLDDVLWDLRGDVKAKIKKLDSTDSRVPGLQSLLSSVVALRDTLETSK